jgi:5-deoxy-glucuronate isomerase
MNIKGAAFMQFHHKPPFNRDLTILSPRGDSSADMLMDFGVLVLAGGETYKDHSAADERAWLLARGTAKISWDGGSQKSKEISRPNLFDYSPWRLSTPAGNTVAITACKEGAEFYFCATDNPRRFNAKLFSPEECQSEARGEGTLRETSTRIVRTVFDDTSRPESNLVAGEVIGIPGKWSSYPPHHHPQPEIYYYRFPDGGYQCRAGEYRRGSGRHHHYRRGGACQAAYSGSGQRTGGAAITRNTVIPAWATKWPPPWASSWLPLTAKSTPLWGTPASRCCTAKL